MGFGDVVAAGGAVDHNIGFVSGAFERNRALRILNAEIIEGAVQSLLAAEELNDLQPVHVALHPSGIQRALRLDSLLLPGEPILVIQRETGGGEKKQDGEARHRQVEVQPARNRWEFAPPKGMMANGRLGGSIRR